jgi:hypothetical protein
LATRLRITDRWPIEVAALLSQLGSITLDPSLVEKLYYGQPLDQREQGLADRMPTVAAQLIAHIPRLEPVAEILRHIASPFRSGNDGHVPIGARILAVAIGFDALDAQGMPPDLALDTLAGRAGRYDPEILREFRALRGVTGRGEVIREIPLTDVRVGMIFVGDVVSSTGQLMIPRGHEVTPSLRARIGTYWGAFARTTIVRVKVPRSAFDGVGATQASGSA